MASRDREIRAVAAELDLLLGVLATTVEALTVILAPVNGLKEAGHDSAQTGPGTDRS